MRFDGKVEKVEIVRPLTADRDPSEMDVTVLLADRRGHMTFRTQLDRKEAYVLQRAVRVDVTPE